MPFFDRQEELRRLREELCRTAVPRLGRKLGRVEFGVAHRFWLGTGPEWDVVALAEDGRALLLGEATAPRRKISSVDFEREIQATLAKGVPPVRRRPDAVVHYGLFCPRLPKRGTRSPPANVHLVEAGDVLSALR